MPIYIGECSTELPAHVCNPCPTADEREFGRVRGAFSVFSDYYPTLLAGITDPEVWRTGIAQGKVIVVPETSGEYDPGDPKSLKGFGDRLDTKGPRTSTLRFFDPNLAANYEHYNSLSGQSELHFGFRTSSQVRIFDKPGTATPKDPVADDIESEVVWDVTVQVVTSNIPSYHSAANLLNTVFKCSWLNAIEVVAPEYDTVLDPETDSAAGVGVTPTAGSEEFSFTFDAITPQIGTPATMNLMLDGDLVAVVDFPTDYLIPSAKPWTYTLGGTTYTGVFTSGDKNL